MFFEVPVSNSLGIMESPGAVCKTGFDKVRNTSFFLTLRTNGDRNLKIAKLQ